MVNEPRCLTAGEIDLVWFTVRDLVKGTDHKVTKGGARRFNEIGPDDHRLKDNWQAVGPLLAQPDDPTKKKTSPIWRRLPQLRNMLRSWMRHLDSDEDRRDWATLLADARLLLPSEAVVRSYPSDEGNSRDRARQRVTRMLEGHIVLPMTHHDSYRPPGDESRYVYRPVLDPNKSGDPPEEVRAVYLRDQLLAGASFNKLMAIKDNDTDEPVLWFAKGLDQIVSEPLRALFLKRFEEWERGHHSLMERWVSDQLHEIAAGRPSRPGLIGALYCALKAEMWYRATDYLAAWNVKPDSPADRAAKRVRELGRPPLHRLANDGERPRCGAGH